MNAPMACDNALKSPRELVVLVHGVACHRAFMWRLGRRLRRAGFATYNWGYPSLGRSMEHHAERFRTQLGELSKQGDVLHIVAHSMGAIITRSALSCDGFPQLGRIVLLAPPNHGSPAARILARLLRRFCPPMSEMSDHPDSFVNRLTGAKGMQIGVIAARFDTVVPLSSTMLDGQTDHICLRATHTSLLFQRSAASQICSFLSTGRFQHAGKPDR
jgi:triacylglycerol lipase